MDPSGNLWVFGGTSLTSSGTGYSNDLWRYTLLKSVSTCPANITIAAASCTGKATVQWAEPRDTFPATISLPSYLDPTAGTLTFMGSLQGHGYYRSDKSYLWPAAKDISHYLGSQDVNGHLVTITSEEENASPGPTALFTGKATGVTSDKTNKELKTIAFPNPGNNRFTVNIRSGNKEKVRLTGLN